MSNTDPFVTAVATAFGNASPTAVTLAFGNTWARMEGTTAQNNPWASEWNGYGGTDYNPQGVKNYPTFQDGVSATVANLEAHAAYLPIIAALRSDGPFNSSGVIAGIAVWGTEDFVTYLTHGGELTNDYTSGSFPAAPVPEPEPTPTAPTTGPTYTVVSPTPGYTTSQNAAAMTGSNSTVPPGTYGIFNQNLGMICLLQHNGALGWWINPAEVPAPAPLPPAPLGDQYTVTHDQPGYVTSRDAALKTGSNSTVVPGTYNVQNRNLGMVALYQHSGAAGWWINPSE